MKAPEKFLLALVAALALLLAGCGGGSNNDDDDMEMEMTSPTAAQIQALATAVTATETALTTLVGEATAAEITAATGSRDALQAAIATARGQGVDTAAAQGVLRRATQAITAAQAVIDTADAEAMTAKLNKLATTIGAVNPASATTLMAHVRTATTKPATAVDGEAPQAIPGWTGGSYRVAGTGGASTETVVYHNQAAPTSVAFNKKYMIITTAGPTKDTTIIDSTAEATRKLVQITGLPTNVNHDGVTVGPVNGVRGMFDGVAGVFTSTSSDSRGIMVGVDEKGVPTWSDGNLHFKPDSATAMVMLADSSYMNLGWWLVSDKDGNPTDVHVAAWAVGPAYEHASKIMALQGTATFEGIAVGKYTHNQSNPVEEISSVVGGHFNADAMLVADFGDRSAEGTLSGTIHNFRQDGESIGDGWKVELGAAATGTPLAFGMTDGKINGATIVNAAVAPVANNAMGTFGNQKTWGTWNAAFVDNSRNDSMPGGVTGQFHIGQDNHPVNLVGAFAAANTVADQPEN